MSQGFSVHPQLLAEGCVTYLGAYGASLSSSWSDVRKWLCCANRSKSNPPFVFVIALNNLPSDKTWKLDSVTRNPSLCMSVISSPQWEWYMRLFACGLCLPLPALHSVGKWLSFDWHHQVIIPDFSIGLSVKAWPRELELLSLNQGKKYYRRHVRVAPLTHGENSCTSNRKNPSAIVLRSLVSMLE